MELGHGGQGDPLLGTQMIDTSKDGSGISATVRTIKAVTWVLGEVCA